MVVNEKNQLGIEVQDDRFKLSWYEDVMKHTISEIDVNSGMRLRDIMRYQLVFLGDDSILENKVRPDILADLRKYRLPVKTYLLRDEAQVLAGKIPLDKFDVKVLRQIDNKHGLFLMGKDLAFNYYKHNSLLQLHIYKTASEDDKEWNSLEIAYIDIDTGQIDIPYFDSDACEEKGVRVDRIITKKTLDDAFESEDFKKFIQMLLFVELSELRIDILQPNEKVGKTKSNKVINRSKSDIIVVTHKWNVISIRTESFLVSGHWRIQPYGKNRDKKKLIYIDTFEKEGYIRRNKSA